jgi:hypothetical protein
MRCVTSWAHDALVVGVGDNITACWSRCFELLFFVSARTAHGIAVEIVVVVQAAFIWVAGVLVAPEAVRVQCSVV